MCRGAMRRSEILKRTALACLLLTAITGCNSVPFGYTRIEPLVKPKGRTVGFVPFRGGEAGSVTLSDRIVLAEMAAVQFRTALPKERSLSPNDMRESLRKGMNEGRWHEIGRDTGAELLVVGEILSMETWHDKLLGAREGTIRLRLRVLDVSQFPPKLVARVKGAVLRFPVGREAKFDTKYVAMDEKAFRRDLLRYASGYVAGLFYEHYVRQGTVTRFDVTVRKE